MARINSVNCARKAQGACYTCRQPITPGQSYNWHKANRFAPRFAWHTTCGAPRPSALESNEKVSLIMAAQEDADDALDALGNWVPDDITYAEFRDHVTEELVTIRDNTAEALREAVAAYEESASNIEDGFGHETDQSIELREKGDQLDSDIGELENHEVLDDPGEDAQQEHWEAWMSEAIEDMRSKIGEVDIP